MGITIKNTRERREIVGNVEVESYRKLAMAVLTRAVEDITYMGRYSDEAWDAYVQKQSLIYTQTGESRARLKARLKEWALKYYWKWSAVHNPAPPPPTVRKEIRMTGAGGKRPPMPRRCYTQEYVDWLQNHEYAWKKQAYWKDRELPKRPTAPIRRNALRERIANNVEIVADAWDFLNAGKNLWLEWAGLAPEEARKPLVQYEKRVAKMDVTPLGEVRRHQAPVFQKAPKIRRPSAELKLRENYVTYGRKE